MFDSTRELLIRKTNDPLIKQFIRYVGDSHLEDMIVEALEKMASNITKGSKANGAIIHYAKEFTPGIDDEIVRDALSHHAAHYKAALDRGGTADSGTVASQHARKIFDMLDMLHKASPHTEGLLHVDSICPKPWERSKLRALKEDGKFITDTKGLSHAGNDFRFLRDAPHFTYEQEINKHGHDGAWPMHEIKVNGKYMHDVDVNPNVHGFVPHPFDSHPIMKHYKEPGKDRSAETDQRYFDEHAAWNDKYHEHFGDHFDKLSGSDPEGFAARGTNKPAPYHTQHATSVYEGVVEGKTRDGETSAEQQKAMHDALFEAHKAAKERKAASRELHSGSKQAETVSADRAAELRAKYSQRAAENTSGKPKIEIRRSSSPETSSTPSVDDVISKYSKPRLTGNESPEDLLSMFEGEKK